MLNGKFLKNKIQRQINQNGSEFLFTRNILDEYDQITDEKKVVKTIKGILHQEMIRVGMNEDNAARIVDVPKTSILCLYDDGLDIKNDDEVTISDLNYKVVDKVNLNSFNVAFEISLEMIKSGKQY